MNQSPCQAGSSPPRQGAFAHADPALDLHSPTPENGDGHNAFLNDVIGMSQGSGALHDSFDTHYAAANGSRQYQTPHYGIGADRNDLHNRQPSQPASSFAAQSNQGLLRGIANYTAAASPGITAANTSYLHDTPSSYFLPQDQSTFVSVTGLQAHSSPQLPSAQHAASYDPTMQRQTKYQPFANLFHDAQQARDHRRRETLFGRMPYLQVDDTIADVERNRTLHVGEIFNAMTSGQAARDNNGSIAMKRWVGNAHYPAHLVEAYAHKVFDCLLQQAKEGFRGWEHNDYVADERKGDDVDREVDCAGRLANIIQALEQEKTICEDVMNSACQIRMFVNAPRAYANRKHQNRVGNSKRGKGKDATDANPRPAKAQRITGRHTRARSSVAPEIPPSRDSTPQFQPAIQRAPNPAPYFSSPISQNNPLSPTSPSYTAPRMPSIHRPTMSGNQSSFQHHSAATNAPPTSIPQTAYSPQSFVPRMASETPSTSPMAAHSTFSPTNSANDAKPILTSGWADMLQFGSGSGGLYEPQVAVDPRISQWDFAEHISDESERSANIFEQDYGGFVNLAHIEHGNPGGVATGSSRNQFVQFWDEQNDVQQMPSNEGQPEYQNRA